MNAFTKWVGTACVALIMTGTSSWSMAGAATPDSIIVMPARARVVQLAFQMSRCKDIGLVTYNTNPTLREPLIHVWNGQEWIQITLQDYVQGSFMSGDPKHVFLLGDNNTLPLRMMDDVAWYKDLHRLTTLDTSTLINQIGRALKFSSYQWKWIAEENGLKIQDQNAERRRYGRWGAPGKEQDLKPTKLEAIELPPSGIIAEPKAEAKVEPKVEPKVEAKVEPKVEAKVEPKVEAKVEPKVEPKVELKLEKTVPPVAQPAISPEKPATPEKPEAVEAPAEPVTTDMADEKDDPAEQ